MGNDIEILKDNKELAIKVKWIKPTLLILNIRGTLFGTNSGSDGSSLGS